jgi:hypothetical protein
MTRGKIDGTSKDTWRKLVEDMSLCHVPLCKLHTHVPWGRNFLRWNRKNKRQLQETYPFVVSGSYKSCQPLSFSAASVQVENRFAKSIQHNGHVYTVVADDDLIAMSIYRGGHPINISSSFSEPAKFVPMLQSCVSSSLFVYCILLFVDCRLVLWNSFKQNDQRILAQRFAGHFDIFMIWTNRCLVHFLQIPFDRQPWLSARRLALLLLKPAAQGLVHTMWLHLRRPPRVRSLASDLTRHPRKHGAKGKLLYQICKVFWGSLMSWMMGTKMCQENCQK